MTDAPFDASALFGDDDELTFEEPAPPPAKKPRAPRKGRAAKAAATETPAAEEPAPAAPPADDPFDFSMLDAGPEPSKAEPAPADDPFDFGDLEAPANDTAPAASAPPADEAPLDFAMFDAPVAAPAVTPAPATPAPVVEAPAVAPPPPAPPRRLSALLTDRIVAGAAALSCLASLAALGGVVSVGRSLAAVETERDAARADRDALARLPRTIAAIDAASSRLAAATAQAQGAQPLSVDDLHHGLDDLRTALAARQPDGLAPLAGMTRDGFSELATRMDQLSARLDGGATPGRRGGRAPYPVPPS